MSAPKFTSLFKINNSPILPPVIDDELRAYIKELRIIVAAKEKEHQNNEVNKSSRLRMRSDSYTILDSPVNMKELLPVISYESLQSSESQISVVAAFDKDEKDLRNEMDKQSIASSIPAYSEVFEPEDDNQVKELLDRQKQEYLTVMETLKSKFSNEQQLLISSLNPHRTSTPLDTTIVTSLSDDDLNDFQTCLQIQTQSMEEEKTIVNEADAQARAATVLNAYMRGYLTRRLFKTIYVQEHIKNIRETLYLLLNDAANSPILLKARLFKQLQQDLVKFNEIFFSYSTRERMKIIAADRELHLKRFAEENEANLSLSFQDVV